jgi:hypothetical protein
MYRVIRIYDYETVLEYDRLLRTHAPVQQYPTYNNIRHTTISPHNNTHTTYDCSNFNMQLVDTNTFATRYV